MEVRFMGKTLVIIVIVTVAVIAGIIIADAFAYSKRYFACGNCGTKFQPKWTSALLVYHVFDEHLLKCPHCNTTSMCTGKGKKI